MYRVDPSGAVALLNPAPPAEEREALPRDEPVDAPTPPPAAAFLGNWDALRRQRERIRARLEGRPFASEEELRRALVDAARRTYDAAEASASEEGAARTTERDGAARRPVLFVRFTRERGLEIARVTQ